MLKVSDPHRFRKTVAGLGMVLAPIVLLAGMVVHPERKTEEAAQLAVVADNLDAWLVAHLLVMVSVVLAVPAVLGLMHMLREREVALGHLGGMLALTGILAVTGLVAIDGFVAWQMGVAGADRAEMTALLERVNETAGVFVPLYLMSFAFALGIVTLALGLYRARAVQWWMAAFLAIAAILLAIAGPTASDVLSIVGAAFLVVGLGSIGRLVLTESEEDWEHTPEYEGFRPLAGMR
jgi:hypothetical protein